MPQKQPHSPEAETRVLAACLKSPDTAIPAALGLGMRGDDFFIVKNQWIWAGITSAWVSKDTPVLAPVISKWLRDRSMWANGMDATLTEIAELDAPTSTIAFWTKQVIDHRLRRDKIEAAKIIAQSSLDMEQDPYLLMTEHQRELDRITARYTRMLNPELTNPADDLRGSQGWYVDTGLPFIDRWLRLVSGEAHGIAGDPGSGKTTIAIHMATHNAMKGVPVVLVLAETYPLEIKLSMLLITGEVDAAFVNRLRYDQTFRTEENLDRAGELWDRHYGGLPFTIYKVDGGPDEVISVVSSHTQPSLVIGDHAYAMVAQSTAGQYVKEHQQYIGLFSGFLGACQRNNHVGVMFNQYTKAGRQTEDRGPDAQYGGSGIQNILGTMIHLRHDESEFSSAAGYRLIHSQCVKARAMILADERGNTIDPRDKEDRYWLETKYRRIVDSLPTM